MHRMHPMTFSVMVDNDTPMYHEAINGPDSEGFYEAMKSEIDTLDTMQPWEIVPCAAASGYNVLALTWDFKRKRFPDGLVRKLKARFCVHGDQQEENVDFF